MSSIFLFILFFRTLAEGLPRIANITVSIGLVLMLLIYILFIQAGRLEIPRGHIMPIYIAFLLFILFLFVGVYLNRVGILNLEVGLKYLVDLTCLFFGFTFTRKNPAYFSKIVLVTMYSAIAPLLYGYYQMLTGQGLKSYEYENLRVFSFFNHPSQYAIYLTIVVAVALHVFLFEKYDRKVKILALGILFSAELHIFFTYTRVSWVVATFITLVMIWKSKNPVIQITAVAAGLLVVLLAGGVILQRFDSLSGTTAATNSMVARYHIWSEMLRRMPKKPFFGYGAASTYTILGDAAHNEYIKLLFEYGIMGATAFLFILANIGGKLLTSRNSQTQVALLVYVGCLLTGLTDNVFDSLVLQIYMWALVGSALGLSSLAKDNYRKRTALYTCRTAMGTNIPVKKAEETT